jgi:methionyl-tRNA synthetase
MTLSADVYLVSNGHCSRSQLQQFLFDIKCSVGTLLRRRNSSSMLALRLCRANLLLEETAPWSALKKGTEDEKAAAGVNLVAALEGARIVSVLLAPVVPSLSSRIYDQLGLNSSTEVCLCCAFAHFVVRNRVGVL